MIATITHFATHIAVLIKLPRTSYQMVVISFLLVPKFHTSPNFSLKLVTAPFWRRAR